MVLWYGVLLLCVYVCLGIRFNALTLCPAELGRILFCGSFPASLDNYMVCNLFIFVLFVTFYVIPANQATIN